jgi:hypothetical protein
LCAAGAAAVGVGADTVAVGADIVEVGAVAGACFGASPFWQAASTKSEEIAATAIITVIFFMVFHLLFFLD